MPTPSNQKHSPSPTSQDECIPDPPPNTLDAEAMPEAASEVSLRLNLLGKLIIPPSVP